MPKWHNMAQNKYSICGSQLDKKTKQADKQPLKQHDVNHQINIHTIEIDMFVVALKYIIENKYFANNYLN